MKLAGKIAYFDWEVYDKYFINGFGRFTSWLSAISGKFDYEGIDQGLVDGVGHATQKMGRSLKQIQTGRLQNYLLFVLAGAILIIIIQAV
jgi:NADH:ubiquinone oxidoreductase subunit 5 (subunit L)/multisubunit Na+/H+ antiporter MnhA subunit